MALSWANAENDASRRNPWIDVRDTKLDFQLVVRASRHRQSRSANSGRGRQGLEGAQ